MPFLNSWCERIFLLSLIILTTIILTDYKFYFLPINGLWLLFYVLCIIISTIWITCVQIQKLLQKHTPFDYRFESCKSYNLFINIISSPFKSTITKKPLKNGSHTPDTEQSILVDSIPFTSDIEISNNETEKQQSIDERIEILVNDLEKKFISKWYNAISTEENFSAESKMLLEGIIRRILQVSFQIDSSKLICGGLIILLKHLKEYRRAIRRVKKNGGSIENVYRYSHIGSKSQTALEHFCHNLTANVSREFISWELWNSLPCRLLVSILSKRLTPYIIYYISQPGWINYKILYQIISKAEIQNLKLDKYLYISLSDVDLFGISEKTEQRVENENNKNKEKPKSVSCTPELSPKKDLKTIQVPTCQNKIIENSKVNGIFKSDSDSVIEQALNKMIKQQTAPILQRAEKTPENNGEKSDTNSPNFQTPFKPIRSEPVKIHSAKSASKRWDESELSNVSLGQDLLALEGLESTGLQGFSGRRLWGYNADLIEQETDKVNPVWELNEPWLKDKENDAKEMTEDPKDSPKIKQKRKDLKESLRQVSPPSSIPHCLRPTTTSASAFVTNTIRPIVVKPTFLAGNVTATTLHNMRELQQSTVNNVVRPVSNATEKAIHKIGDLQDEAVGVVEGIFDFGMAGLRKGLRLTGLQDINDTTQKSKPQEPVKQSPKTVPKLVKVGHVSSTIDETKSNKNTIDNSESVWINPIAKEESPNGYENQILLEKSPNAIETDSSIIESCAEIPGITETNLFLTESPEYEETADLASTISKLRSLLQQKSSESSLNTPAVSPMPMEDKSCPTPTDPVITDVIRGDGGMQRFARTVTGMFNTFKTALPGNISEQSKIDSEQWIFIENETSETDLPSLLNSLLIERRDYCTVDTAYEAMDSLDLLTESVNSQIGKIQWDNQVYEDELDDLESAIPITKALLDVICECLQDTNCAVKQEPVMKSLLIMAGSKIENKLSQYSEKILKYINKAIGPLPKNEDDNVMAMKLNQIVELMETSFPCYVKEIFGHEDLKIGLKFFISSLQSVKMNQDMTLEFLELVCSQLIYASSQMSPTPSA